MDGGFFQCRGGISKFSATEGEAPHFPNAENPRNWAEGAQNGLCFRRTLTQKSEFSVN